MSRGDPEDEDLLALLEDEYAREILVQTWREPCSARTLCEACDASRATIYRRIERLQTHDLLESRTQLDPDGHHRDVYAACLRRVTIEVTDDGIEIDVDRVEPDAATRFTKLYEEFTG